MTLLANPSLVLERWTGKTSDGQKSKLLRLIEPRDCVFEPDGNEWICRYPRWTGRSLKCQTKEEAYYWYLRLYHSKKPKIWRYEGRYVCGDWTREPGRDYWPFNHGFGESQLAAYRNWLERNRLPARYLEAA